VVACVGRGGRRTDSSLSTETSVVVDFWDLLIWSRCDSGVEIIRQESRNSLDSRRVG